MFERFDVESSVDVSLLRNDMEVSWILVGMVFWIDVDFKITSRRYIALDLVNLVSVQDLC